MIVRYFIFGENQVYVSFGIWTYCIQEKSIDVRSTPEWVITECMNAHVSAE